MMTSINGKSYQICYRCGVIKDFIIRSLKSLGPFNRFGYFRLVFKSILFLDSADPRYLEEKEEKWDI